MLSDLCFLLFGLLLLGRGIMEVVGKLTVDLEARRRFVLALAFASISFARLLTALGLIHAEHIFVRRVSSMLAGFGSGVDEAIQGVRMLKAEIGGTECRVYLPETKSDGNSLTKMPVCIYIHGGGWVISSAHEYHRFAALYARDTQTIVVSVDYRLAPEHPFPAGLDDCLTVTLAILNLQFPRGLFYPHSIDEKRVVLAGDSAGANLACATALDLIRNHDYRLFGLLLVCPSLQAVTLDLPSYSQFRHNIPIGYDWFVPRYAGIARPSQRLIESFRNGTQVATVDRQMLTQKMTSSSSFSTMPPRSKSCNLTSFDNYSSQQMISDESEGEKCRFYIGNDEEGESDDMQSVDSGLPQGSTDDSSVDDEKRILADFVRNKRAWPLLADDEELRHLPRTAIQICERDPIRSEGELFAERMRRAGAFCVEESLLENADHIEALLEERLPTSAARKGYQQLVDFMARNLLSQS